MILFGSANRGPKYGVFGSTTALRNLPAAICGLAPAYYGGRPGAASPRMPSSAPIAGSSCVWPQKKCATCKSTRGYMGRSRAFLRAASSRQDIDGNQRRRNRANLDRWPYEEARRLDERAAKLLSSIAARDLSERVWTVGPAASGHDVRSAAPFLRAPRLQLLAPERPTRLIVFIDDMDGLRKAPENLPNREQLLPSLGKPVSQIPDPFGCCPSFAEHMVGQLVKFLEPVEVDYEFLRSSEMYAERPLR